MSYTADQLIILAASLEELASNFLEKTAKKKEDKKSQPKGKFPFWLKNKKTKDTNEAKNKKPEHEMTHEEWEKVTPRMKDWSNKDWSKYLNKNKKDTNEAKDKKKLDPSAAVRNRGTVCVSAESAKDKKDHFPINDEGQARSALSRVEGLTSAPWYNGSLEGLRALVKRKVHSKYPSIGKDKSSKKSSEILDNLLTKYS